MQKTRTNWRFIAIFLSAPVLFIYMTFANSIDCDQLVIDTYEIHSGINIPKVDFVNCYYDEQGQTRISVYDLKGEIILSKFVKSNDSSTITNLKGIGLLTESERPKGNNFYLASGEKWGRKWTYIFDPQSQRLWAELNY